MKVQHLIDEAGPDGDVQLVPYDPERAEHRAFFEENAHDCEICRRIAGGEAMELPEDALDAPNVGAAAPEGFGFDRIRWVRPRKRPKSATASVPPTPRAAEAKARRERKRKARHRRRQRR